MIYKPRDGELPVLVLQGGGALGAYQAGAFEAIDAEGYAPDWIAGISIGGINAALIAGNPPERRVERLREFWDIASSSDPLPAAPASEPLEPWFTELRANWIAAFGVPGFFSPRFPPPLLQPPGTSEAVSFYDTTPLRATLERLVDFDLLNSGPVRVSLGATHVTTGNFCYFDSARHEIRPEHVIASGALPPGFPPVEIEGELYWDGGLVSNTPLQYVLDQETRRDLLIFQVDLFSSHGAPPRTLFDVEARTKDIRFSSRRRANTDRRLEMRRAKALIRELIAEAPPEWRQDPRVRELHGLSKEENAVTVVQLIFRPKHYTSSTKGYEFSRATILKRWRAGLADVEQSLNHRAWLRRRRPKSGIAVFDLGEGGPKVVRDTTIHHAPAQELTPQRARAPAAGAGVPRRAPLSARSGEARGRP
jgi:NTE family protein